MITGYSPIEYSRQNIPRTPEVEALDPAESRPLYELASVAPKGDLKEFRLGDIHYSFSNDEAAPYFDQLRIRSTFPEFQNATNRTAVLIGESSLIAALPYIEEDTIILLDKSPAMCEFMSRYVEGLKQCETIEEWLAFMGIADEEDPRVFRDITFRINEQIYEWELSGHRHGLNSQEVYSAVRDVAKDKAFIPWCADMTDRRAMKRLGKTLKSYNANVTFMNLTNAMPCTSRFNEAHEFVKRFEYLPVTPNAPILTTGGAKDGGYIVEMTGPFFGLENLKKFGGKTQADWPGGERGPSSRRQYIESRIPGSFNRSAELGGVAITLVHLSDGRVGFVAEFLGEDLET